MIILTGKSCSGKTTIAYELCKLGYSGIVGYTTRPPREGEVEGEAYHFISNDDFEKRAGEGFFAESRSFHVANGETWYYGTALEDLDEDKVVVLNPYGVKKLKEIPEVNPVVFYISVRDETIQARMERRGQDRAEALRRMRSDIEDFYDMEETADFIVHNDTGVPPEQIARAVSQLYMKTVRSKHKYQHQKEIFVTLPAQSTINSA